MKFINVFEVVMYLMSDNLTGFTNTENTNYC